MRFALLVAAALAAPAYAAHFTVREIENGPYMALSFTESSVVWSPMVLASANSAYQGYAAAGDMFALEFAAAQGYRLDGYVIDFAGIWQTEGFAADFGRVVVDNLLSITLDGTRPGSWSGSAQIGAVSVLALSVMAETQASPSFCDFGSWQDWQCQSGEHVVRTSLSIDSMTVTPILSPLEQRMAAVSAVPEPSTYALMLLGLGALAIRRVQPSRSPLERG